MGKMKEQTMGVYTMTGIKTFEGMEGRGFNATLLRDGKKIAFVINEGNGGCLNISYTDAKGKALKMSESRGIVAMLEAKVLALKPTKSDEKEPGGYSDRELFCLDIYLEELVEDVLEMRAVKRWCKTKTVIQEKGAKPGDFITYKRAYSPEMKAYVLKEHGADVRILNEEVSA